jgi:hypothetical protein
MLWNTLVNRVKEGLPARLASRVARLRPDLAFFGPSASSRRLLVNGQERSDISGIRLPALGYSAPDPIDAAGIAICERLIAAYHLALRSERQGKSSDDMWSIHAHEYHQEVCRALESRDPSATLRVLAGMFTDPVTTGLALGRGTYDACVAHPRATQLDWHDKAISLGISLGMVAAQCPEQGEYGTLLDLDSPSVLGMVVKHLGVSLAPPQCGGIFGVETMGSIYPVNYLLHICTAHRLRSLIAAAQGSSACLEIGGGVGFLAYAALVMGIRRFSIIDLPISNVLQGYYLLRSQFSDRVRLYGEPAKEGDSSIDILPTTSIDELPARSFEIAINQDSFPEMGRAVAVNYLRQLPTLAKTFLSINQESQTRISDSFSQNWTHQLCAQNPSMRLMYRAPYWMRKGYVEELYAM